MPELPEVETIRRQLFKVLKNKKIIDVEIKVPKMVRAPLLTFKKNVVGSKIFDIGRKAKLLIIGLSNGFSLLIHLKLTGQLIVKNEKDKPEKYTHFIFYFSDGTKLFFNDLRKFGFINIIKTVNLEKQLEKEKFGPEPLEKGFTLKLFKNLLEQKKISKIKPLLMDQTFIAGIGNIYAAEACFYAGIKPTRPAGSLKLEQIKKLHEGIKKILKEAIRKKGSSVNAYVDTHGRKGKYVPFLKVYDRKGEKCVRCGAKIKMIKLAGRGAYFCPKCQK